MAEDSSRKRPSCLAFGGGNSSLATNHAATAATAPPQVHGLDSDDEDEDELAVSDAEATVLLLRQQLYPDPAAAAAAASAAKQSRHSKRSKTAAGPSKATAAAVTAAAAAAAAAKSLPPIVLKSQLYTVLTDRTAADRDLEGLRQQGRVRVFKLAIGADEYVLLLADDYCSLIDSLIHKHQQQAAAQAAREQQHPHAAAGDSASIAATLQLFRDRVVPAWRDSSIPRSTLLQLLHTPPTSAAAPAAASRPQQQPHSQLPYERQLMAVDLMTRDSRSPDSYQLTVPGAAAFVKSVLTGRQEMTKLLSRKKFNEVLEKELLCTKLRNSCLTPTFIMRDLQGRGLITLSDTTAGPLVRLAQRK